MRIRNLTATVIIITFFSAPLASQTFMQPNFALKSHETLDITKVGISPEKTTISLSIENRRIEGGSFCADKNIFIIYPEGNRVRLVRANGIPECPQNYKFKSVGEKLDFSLIFPPIKPGTEWIDIIEECSTRCFWFYGITLNNDLNKRLDEAFATAFKGKPADNILLFCNILESVDNQDLGIEGSLYINIINAAIEAGDKIEAAVWYKRLLSSRAPRLSQYVKFLNDRGIKY